MQPQFPHREGSLIILEFFFINFEIIILGYYPTGHEDYQDQTTGHDEGKDHLKEMSLKDLFDIALTTLAFLSFGMFILQVLMCITMVSYL